LSWQYWDGSIVRTIKNIIKDRYEKESAISVIKKFVMHLWNPEIGFLNNNYRYCCIFSLQLTVHKRIMDCAIAILDGLFFFALTVL
jgi:hypothetical protein